MPSLRVENEGAVRSLVLCRPEALNVITPDLRDELGVALDEAEADPAVKVVLLRAEGRAFCAGFGIDWAADLQAEEATSGETWDPVADLALISTFAHTWARLHDLPKPTIAAVHGWCIAGGTDMVLNADLIIAAESAVFGYPPARAWGTPEAAWVWVARLGLERAKRYLFTGDEIPGPEAARLGMVLECVPDDELLDRAAALARRIALLPANQLAMLKLLCNQVADQLYRPAASRLLGSLFDGIARHTSEGLDFVDAVGDLGVREAVRRRDEPFGDYGARR
jgi:enoyl-CoA hydratase